MSQQRWIDDDGDVCGMVGEVARGTRGGILGYLALAGRDHLAVTALSVAAMQIRLRCGQSESRTISYHLVPCSEDGTDRHPPIT